MHTDGTVTQNTPVNDGKIFVGVSEWISTTAMNTLFGVTAEGNAYLLFPTGATTNIYKNIEQILRSGIFATMSSGQAFGTKGPPPAPGPSLVPGTSDPRAINNRPPMNRTQMPTLIGAAKQPPPKGIMITSVDVIATNLAAAITSASIGLTSTAFPAAGAGAAAPVVTPIIPYGTNGLPTAASTNPATVNVPVVNPQWIIPTTPVAVILHIGVVTGAGTTAFYGVNLHVTYNYN